ncbi:hypothetical protein NDN08_002611 [Rhodosorus marinus]|uniref:Tetratricopeptide repeat protein 38 n=1 Tax=Rhodosorus marinus TaxID=101924 RepID=A0AAV8UYG3_9RHOD|nr:hypothetical protein NDN08_002611 [Rhodosorus marinus]
MVVAMTECCSPKVEDEYGFDLGSMTWKVSTVSEEAQRWFDRGVNWSFGFNHEEAILCFQKAASADPECLMAHWAMAWANSPNYNLPEMAIEEFPSNKLACQHLEKATELLEAGAGTALEQALVIAIKARFESSYEPETEQRARLDKAYQAEMEKVYDRFPDNSHIAALYTESLIQISPWQLYDMDTCEPIEEAKIARQVLEKALAADPTHPGLCHYYVHCMEMSTTPEVALLPSEPIRNGQVPDSGHLFHMPAHIDILLGRYAECLKVNKKAQIVDKKWCDARGSMNWYLLYRLHTVHFIVYAGMMLGDFQSAIDAARDIRENFPVEILHVPEKADWFEGFLTTRYHVLVRFGKWETIINEPYPEPQELYPFVSTIVAYSKTVAYASLREVEKAKETLSRFRELRAKIPETRRMLNNLCSVVLEIAEGFAVGEIHYREGKFEEAYESLEESVRHYEGLLYDEPWGWMMPPRHPLGAFLLEQGEYERAEKVYRADLRPARRGVGNPNNVWSLVGLRDCLARKDDEASKLEKEQIDRKLRDIRAETNVEVRASCLCALSLVSA